MKTTVLLEKLWLEKKEFVTSKDLKEYCKLFKLKYDSAIHYLLKMKYVVRIFRGIFYIKSLEEAKMKKSKYSHLELVAKGLELKGVKNWYFGLHTALKLNNMTHEYFTIDEVISDSLFRAKPVTISGYKFRFVKISPSLLSFGVIRSKNTMLPYSDPEKTILDFIYLMTQEGKDAMRAEMDVSEWAENTSREKIRKYSKNYPKTVANIAETMNK
ncbi:type IV toxin-antitoxin system AbiEi family antitoxin domain-containing protein [Candidatus Nitrosotenuis cloacae]|jgi:predicted transcriptional regulator of viral defense system|uniref:type IV toxin-antitoxin system AbiEi family antitoxin domain-containing protein n=1 Tax=Candidatus Nitrosotenuis cloacae TaxID=1603555 RepID=UPI00227E31F8|nr:hypothetical protein [Candidatus Nitrosotenuis cloacae]